MRPNGKVERFLQKAGREFDAFFKFKINEPLIFLLNTRKEMDAVWNRRTENWVVGGLIRRNIYIFSPDVYAKVSSHKKEDFWTTLKHEYCHSYYQQICNTSTPVWLNEGLACFLSGKKVTYTKFKKEYFLGVFKYFSRFDADGYALSQFWVEKLLKKFGKTKMVALIKSLSQEMTERDFALIFKKIYKIEYSKKSFEKMLAGEAQFMSKS